MRDNARSVILMGGFGGRFHIFFPGDGHRRAHEGVSQHLIHA